MNKLAFAPARIPAAALMLWMAQGAAMAADVAPEPAGALPPAATSTVALVPTARTNAATTSAMAKSPFSGPAVSQRLLAGSRAGSATAVVTETGSLQQTTATNVQTGTNAIAGGSFANALGLTTVIQNSGANVLIQNATTINVQFK